MNGHPFNFDGGLALSRIGATWFVSYLYYLNIDKSHLNWKNCETERLRINVFEKNNKYHKYWLGKILEMNDRRLNTARIGVDAYQTKMMAKELLKIL